MASFVYRFLFLLIGLSPMAIGIFCVGKTNPKEVFWGMVYGICVCEVALLLFYLWSERVTSKLEGVPIKPVTITRKREGLSGYFLAYVLPLILTEPVEKWILLLVVMILVFAGLNTKSIGYNPIAELIGYNFYDIDDGSGITVLVISKRTPQQLFEGFKAVTLTEDYLIDKGEIKKPGSSV